MKNITINSLSVLTLNEKNITSFAYSRNKLLKSSKSEWVLFLDTDEKLSKGLEKEITELNPEGYNGFYINRKIIFLRKEIGEDRVLRLGRKNAGKWERKVHETWNIKGKVGTLESYIIHNTADNLHGYIDKMNKYSTIHAAENLREGKRSSLYRIILFPKFKLIQNMIQGRGFTFSMLQSFHSFLGWAKLWQLQKD